MTEPNIPMLRKGVEWVEEQAVLPIHRRRWNQASYVRDWWGWFVGLTASKERHELRDQTLDCRTACCFAGYIAQEFEPGFAEKSVDYQNGRARNVATKLLGITESQAENLFSGNNSPVKIRKVAEQIAGQKL